MDALHARLAMEHGLGLALPAEGDARDAFGDSIIADTTAEKEQEMVEVAAGLLADREYRVKRYCEDEDVARSRAGGYHTGNGQIPR